MIRAEQKQREIKEYQDIANILVNDIGCRRDNRKLFKKYYRDIWGISLDEAFTRNDVPNYQTIERKARLIKAKNPHLKIDKEELVDKYKEIALEIPVVVEVI